MVDLSLILTQLEFRLSGGEDNINPFQSLGGVMSNAVPDALIVDGKFDNVWDDITVQERLLGDVSYRWIYFYNNSLETIFDLRMYFLQLDPFCSATFHKGGPMVAASLLANEHTRPPDAEVGPAATAYTGMTDHFETTSEQIPVLRSFQWQAISLRRVIPIKTDSHLEAQYKLIIESRA